MIREITMNDPKTTTKNMWSFHRYVVQGKGKPEASQLFKKLAASGAS